jgi:hypothetical protein
VFLLPPEVAIEVKTTHPTDLTNHCWVIADDGIAAGNAPHVVIGLHPQWAAATYQMF